MSNQYPTQHEFEVDLHEGILRTIKAPDLAGALESAAAIILELPEEPPFCNVRLKG